MRYAKIAHAIRRDTKTIASGATLARDLYPGHARSCDGPAALWHIATNAQLLCNEMQPSVHGRSRSHWLALLQRFGISIGVGLTLVTALPSSVHAQPARPAKPAEVVPPRLLKDSPARYPEQALKDRVREKVTVNLILEVDANGTVKNASIDVPAGHGFDEAAASAASTLVFEPATRNGTPTAAMIRFAYTLSLIHI